MLDLVEVRVFVLKGEKNKGKVFLNKVGFFSLVGNEEIDLSY